MLTLSRRAGERIVLLLEGELLATVTLVAIRPNHNGSNLKARIGIEAPQGIRVLRAELWHEELAAESARPDDVPDLHLAAADD